MRGKIRLSRWLLAATVLVVAECTGAPSLKIALPAAHAELSSDLFRSSWARPQSDKFFQNLFASQNWRRQQRNTHRPTDSSRTLPQHRTKLTPDPNEPATVQNVPLPRPRPPAWPEPHSFAEAAGPDFNTVDVTSAPSDCNQRLATIAVIELLPRLIGPGDCGGRDMVRLDAVMLLDHRRVEANSKRILRTKKPVRLKEAHSHRGNLKCSDNVLNKISSFAERAYEDSRRQKVRSQRA